MKLINGHDVNEMSEITGRWTVALFMVKCLGNPYLNIFTDRKTVMWGKPDNCQSQ